jgi:hypothetical protein
MALTTRKPTEQILLQKLQSENLRLLDAADGNITLLESVGGYATVNRTQHP